MKVSKIVSHILVLLFGFAAITNVSSQDKAVKSIGGEEHDSNIYGVKIGMDVPTALETVFVNAKRKPGQEKPDALKKEGKDNKDIRVVYKDLPKGELQIVFAEGISVSEIILNYKKEPIVDDLRLPFSNTIGDSPNFALPNSSQPVVTDLSVPRAGVLDGNVDVGTYSANKIGNVDRSRTELLDGERYDDRYSIAFVDSRKLQRIWWREEKTQNDYKIRVSFIGKKTTEAGGKFVPSIVQKSISIVSGDKDKFLKN
jgi:hypothetical protein